MPSLSRNIILGKGLPWFVGTVVAMVGLLLFCTPHPHLFLSGTRLNLGDVSVDEVREKAFTIFNHSSTPVVIAGWIPSCHCMRANFSQKVILPGMSADARVQTTGSTPLGMHAAVISVQWHFLGDSLIRTDDLVVSARYVSPLSLSEEQLDFGTVPLSCMPQKSLNVSPGNLGRKWNSLDVQSSSEHLSASMQATSSGFRIQAQINPQGLPTGIWKSSLKLYPLENGSKTGEVIDIPVVARIEGPFSVEPPVLSFLQFSNHSLTFTLKVHSSAVPIRKLRILGSFVRKSKVVITKDGKDAVVVGCLASPVDKGIVVGKIPLQINDNPDASVQLSFICYPS